MGTRSKALATEVLPTGSPKHLGETHKPQRVSRREQRADCLRFFTIADVADLLRVSEKTVQRWIGARLLPAYRLNGLVRIAEDDFRAFLALRRKV